MSFRYTIHLNSGQKMRSGSIDDSYYHDTVAMLIDFLKHSSGCYAFKPEQDDTAVVQLIVGREIVNYVSFLNVV